MNNLNAAGKEWAVVKDLESYWSSFRNPESDHRIRIVPTDLFSHPLTLRVSNEHTSGASSESISISLITHEGVSVYRQVEQRDICLTVTANANFFAIVMKSGKISIHDTKSGALIVPYYQKGNIVHISSHADGHLAWLDLSGKFTVIDVYLKKLIFENWDSVKTLLTNLNDSIIINKLIEIDPSFDENSEQYYVENFYIDEKSVYLEVINSESICKSVFWYNTNLKVWEQVDPISLAIINDNKIGNIGSVSVNDMEIDNPIAKPGIGTSIEIREKELFKLEKVKTAIIDDIGLAISMMEKTNRAADHDYDSLDALEQRIMLYERLEHKTEFFITLETYILKLVKQGDVERLGKIVSKYDSQYGVHKKLKFESEGDEELFMGMKKCKILEHFIKPKIQINQEVFKKVFKTK